MLIVDKNFTFDTIILIPGEMINDSLKTGLKYSHLA